MKRISLPASLLLLAALLAGCTGSQAGSISPPPASPVPPSTATPASEVRPELEKYFQGLQGSFVLYDLNQDRYIRYHPERCAEGLIPASTFKILNALIGLETSVIPDENYVIQWDGTRYPVASWNQDHTLKTAMQNSVVWYYQELARRVGQQKMQSYVDATGYGNQDISGGIDLFWLEGKLKISADQQVEFLKHLYRGDLPFSSRSIRIVKEILVLEKSGAYQLSGKTGSAQLAALQQGWFVGYLETKGNVYFFATNFESSNPDRPANGVEAKKISLEILHDLGLLP